MTRKILLTGTVFGVTAIILGAFGAHALKAILDESSLASFKTAVNYQMYHALFLLLFGLVQLKFGKSLTRVIYYLCTIGVLCFSGSIYFLVLNNHFQVLGVPKLIALITPIGGLLLITSWILFGVYIFKHIKNDA